MSSIRDDGVDFDLHLGPVPQLVRDFHSKKKPGTGPGSCRENRRANQLVSALITTAEITPVAMAAST
jgi:hypothetical protein